MDINELLKEREKDYGNATIMAEKVIAMFNILTDSKLDSKELFNMLIILKLVREYNAHKDDNCNDLGGYAELLKQHNNKIKAKD